MRCTSVPSRINLPCMFKLFYHQLTLKRLSNLNKIWTQFPSLFRFSKTKSNLTLFQCKPQYWIWTSKCGEHLYWFASDSLNYCWVITWIQWIVFHYSGEKTTTNFVDFFQFKPKPLSVVDARSQYHSTFNFHNIQWFFNGLLKFTSDSEPHCSCQLTNGNICTRPKPNQTKHTWRERAWQRLVSKLDKWNAILKLELAVCRWFQSLEKVN